MGVPAEAQSEISHIPAARSLAHVTVIIPVFNEQNTIRQLLNRVIAEPTPKEIVIVDDGSTDETAIRLEAWQTDLYNQSLPGQVDCAVILRHEQNRGKGTAIRTALAAAHAEYVIVQDADLEVSPEEYPRLLEPLEAGRADIVVGFRKHSNVIGQRPVHNAGICVLNLLVRLWYGIWIRDEACCFKVLRTRSLRLMNLKCSRFEFCPEVIAKAARLGLRFEQVPIQYYPRGAAAGKKLKLRDGWQAIQTLWRYRRWRPD